METDGSNPPGDGDGSNIPADGNGDKDGSYPSGDGDGDRDGAETPCCKVHHIYGDEDRDGADPCSKVHHRHEDGDGNRDRADPKQKTPFWTSEIQNFACRWRMTQNRDIYKFN